jgi:hypothetical protein
MFLALFFADIISDIKFFCDLLSFDLENPLEKVYPIIDT